MEEERIITVYALINEQNEIFYVGQSSRVLLRFRAHQQTFGPRTRMLILESVTSKEKALSSERMWIYKKTLEGSPLLNTPSYAGTGFPLDVRARVAADVEKKITVIRVQMLQEAFSALSGASDAGASATSVSDLVGSSRATVFNEVWSALMKRGARGIDEAVRTARAKAGGTARANALSEEEKREIGRKGAEKRWGKKDPE